jgi:hypothetical protein
MEFPSNSNEEVVARLDLRNCGRRKENNTGAMSRTPISAASPIHKMQIFQRYQSTKDLRAVLGNATRKADPFNQPTDRSYQTDGEGSERIVVEQVAEKKQLTTANLDRWRRTFQSARMMLQSRRPKPIDEEKEEELVSGISGLKSQATSVQQDDTPEDEMFDEITRREGIKSWGVVYPEAIPKLLWDLLAFAFVVVQAIITPFKLAFIPDMPYSWDVFEVVMDFYFFLDIRIVDV